MHLVAREIVTPLGGMLALASDDGVCALEFLSTKRIETWCRRHGHTYGGSRTRRAALGVLGVANEWLRAYFDARFDILIPQVEMRCATKFERAVWQELQRIKAGSTTTYTALAIGCGYSSTYARAIGTAVRRNPLSLIVPCHRVVGADGALVGYGGTLERKRWLLEHEAASAGKTVAIN